MTTNDEAMAADNGAAGSNVVALPGPARGRPDRKLANFVHDHPVMCIAGGLAAGALAAALIPSRNRKFIARRASVWSEAVTAAGAAIAQQALDQLNSASSGLRDQAGSLATKAGDAGHAAMNRMERVSEVSIGKAQALLRRAKPEPTLSEKIAAAAGELIERIQR